MPEDIQKRFAMTDVWSRDMEGMRGTLSVRDTRFVDNQGNSALVLGVVDAAGRYSIAGINALQCGADGVENPMFFYAGVHGQTRETLREAIGKLADTLPGFMGRYMQEGAVKVELGALDSPLAQACTRKQEMEQAVARYEWLRPSRGSER